MTNKEIAHNLTQIAKILEIIDAERNHFRVIAYERAADLSVGQCSHHS